MEWQKVADLRYGIDEARPGFDDYREAKRYKGKQFDVVINKDWPAYPRLELPDRYVIPDSIGCVAGLGIKLDVVDKTNEDEMTMPPLGATYLSLYNGPNFDTAYIYLHTSCLGETVYLDYEYYPEDDRWAYITVKDDTLYAATIKGRYYQPDSTSRRLYDIPGAPNSLTRDVVWAGGRSLFRFGRKHRPAISTINQNEQPRLLATSLAVSYDGDLRFTPDHVLSLSARRRPKEYVVPAKSVLRIRVSNRTIYGAVRAVFDGGAVVAGNGRELQVNLPTISDVGIARSVAERIRKTTLGNGAVYNVSTMGEYGANIGDTVLVPGVFRGVVISVKRYLDIERTDFEILTPKKGAESFEQEK